MTESEALMLKINPAVMTAKACLLGSASMGDPDAVKLYESMKKIDNPGNDLPKADIPHREETIRLIEVFGASAWLRHVITDRFFNSLRMTCFVDLGCGFNQRGLTFSGRKNVKYYGIDLPSVTQQMYKYMYPVVVPAHLDNRIKYYAADVTDYNALRSVIKGKEMLFITTEGLMMYLTQKESETVIENIRKLLVEFGGVWVTGDADFGQWNDLAAKKVLGGDEMLMERIGSTVSSEKQSSIVFENSFVSLKGEKRRKYFEKRGFIYSEKSVTALIDNLDIPEPLREVYEKAKFIVLTAKEIGEHIAPAGKSGFSVDSYIFDGGFDLYVNGRLDAVNAPALVSEFEKRIGVTTIYSVTINMDKCTYISSAGIRAVLMIMKRSKKLGAEFDLKNITPDVFEILQTTGFDRFG